MSDHLFDMFYGSAMGVALVLVGSLVLAALLGMCCLLSGLIQTLWGMWV
jgi:hypothetical protein